MTPDPLTLAQQVDILFEYAEAKHMVTTYQGISRAIDVAAINIQKLRKGVTTDPTVSTLRKVSGYFGVGLGYFDCRTEAECWEYIQMEEQKRAIEMVGELAEVASLRAEKISPEVLDALEGMIERVRESEAEEND